MYRLTEYNVAIADSLEAISLEIIVEKI